MQIKHKNDLALDLIPFPKKIPTRLFHDENGVVEQLALQKRMHVVEERADLGEKSEGWIASGWLMTRATDRLR